MAWHGVILGQLSLLLQFVQCGKAAASCDDMIFALIGLCDHQIIQEAMGKDRCLQFGKAGFAMGLADVVGRNGELLKGDRSDCHKRFLSLVVDPDEKATACARSKKVFSSRENKKGYEQFF